MFIDELKTLVREQNPPWDPGRYGDSSYETSSYQLARFELGDYLFVTDLTQFVTPIGTIRHPKVPDDWKETDMTTDNEILLYMASKRAGLPQANFIKNKVISRGYRTGNGDFISPGYLAELNDWQSLRCVSLAVQSLFFKIPVRWSDASKEPWYKFWHHIESSKDACDGYVHWMHCAVNAPKFVRKMISKETLKSKIRLYYKKEPNSQWIIDVLDQVIDRYF